MTNEAQVTDAEVDAVIAKYVELEPNILDFSTVNDETRTFVRKLLEAALRARPTDADASRGQAVGSVTIHEKGASFDLEACKSLPIGTHALYTAPQPQPEARYRAVTLEDAQEVSRVYHFTDVGDGLDSDMLAALQSINAVIEVK